MVSRVCYTGLGRNCVSVTWDLGIMFSSSYIVQQRLRSQWLSGSFVCETGTLSLFWLEVLIWEFCGCFWISDSDVLTRSLLSRDWKMVRTLLSACKSPRVVCNLLPPIFSLRLRRCTFKKCKGKIGLTGFAFEESLQCIEHQFSGKPWAVGCQWNLIA